MPRNVHVCPICSHPIIASDTTITLVGVRHHLGCARSAELTPRSRGRPPKRVGYRAQDIPPIQVRVTADQRQRWELHALERGASLADHVRQCLDDYYRRAHAPDLASVQMDKDP